MSSRGGSSAHISWVTYRIVPQVVGGFNEFVTIRTRMAHLEVIAKERAASLHVAKEVDEAMPAHRQRYSSGHKLAEPPGIVFRRVATGVSDQEAYRCRRLFNHPRGWTRCWGPDESRARKSRGSGSGRSLCRRILELYRIVEMTEQGGGLVNVTCSSRKLKLGDWVLGARQLPFSMRITPGVLSPVV